MMLAAIGDYIGYGFSMVIMIAIPAAGLVINVAGMQRRGLNRWAGISACLYFFTLLVQGTTVSLAEQGAFSDAVWYWLIAGTLALNVVGGFMALFALWQMRRKVRWPRGTKRATAVFWLNVITLLFASAAFYLRINPELTKKIFG